jgi:TonB-dependent starch-binding outer membrane protein SusC
MLLFCIVNKNIMKHLLTLLIVLSVSFTAMANNKDRKNTSNSEASAIEFTGKVIDESGEPIVGAEIKLNNTSVYTDINGEYNVTALPNSEVEIHFVSFKTQKFQLKANQNTITLKED